jgi:hypothetical protein
LILGWIVAGLVLILASAACGVGNGGKGTGPEAATPETGMVPYGDLVAYPDQYTGMWLCTEGIHASGFEVNDLGTSTYEKDGYPHLAEPVIWLEQADFQSRQDCHESDTTPSFEFCQAVVCGVFEMGGGYGHLGAYEYQIRGEGIQPPASATPSTASPSPESGPSVEPPQAVLEVAGQEQVSGIGSYCWSQPTNDDSAMAVCADMIGTITPGEPLTVPAAFEARFRLAPEDTPAELVLWVRAVSPEEELGTDQEGWRAWPGIPGENYPLALEQEPALKLNLEPGLYVLDLFGRWETWGSASYGFLLEVTAGEPLPVPVEVPALLIEETPIVASSVDGPGHFEYGDLLGKEILARIEGLSVRDVELRLDEANKALAPFGYWLEAKFDAEWNRTFYDFLHEDKAEPVLTGLSHIWPVSVNASGTDFVMAAENAPNTLPLYLLVRRGSVEEWDAMVSNLLPPAYVGDALATITTTPEMTLTYQVLLDSKVVYTGMAALAGAYHPLRTFTTWEDHWALEVDDRVIVDGQDLGAEMGYGAVFGFTRIRDQAFYFFEQNGQIHLSYGGRTLPNTYDQVFHNQCCEASIHNVTRLADSVLFHALWDGTWHFVEAGVFDGEMVSTYRYSAPEGWSIRYPAHWDRLDPELGFVQETATGKTVIFVAAPTSEAELESWLEAEIARKLAATEARNTLTEPLTEEQAGGLAVYRYAVLSQGDGSEALLRTTVLFDGRRRYAFYAAVPPVADEEYEAIVRSFQVRSQE